jgi:hypothetical protein
MIRDGVKLLNQTMKDLNGIIRSLLCALLTQLMFFGLREDRSRCF